MAIWEDMAELFDKHLLFIIMYHNISIKIFMNT